MKSTSNNSNSSDNATVALKLETETCGRCGGSGHYSYCSMYGTTCFKCAGSGKVYTKRGAQAAIYLRGLRSKPYSEISVGDVIQAGGVTMGGQPYTRWDRVKSIESGEQVKINGAWHCVKAGAAVPAGDVEERRPMLIVEVVKEGTIWTDPAALVVVYGSREFRIETLRKAVEFQNGLKGGKSAEQKAADKAKRQEREAAKIEEGRKWFAENREALQQVKHPNGYRASLGASMADYVAWMIDNAGRTGEANAIKMARAAVAQRAQA